MRDSAILRCFMLAPYEDIERHALFSMLMLPLLMPPIRAARYCLRYVFAAATSLLLRAVIFQSALRHATFIFFILPIRHALCDAAMIQDSSRHA